MGNFFKRTVSFILGMIFMLVTLVGAIAGGAYWAFKNLTLDKVVQDSGLGELGSWTVEDWYATFQEASTNPEGFTLKTLEENGYDLDGMLTSMGVDLETANPQDVNALKSISVGTLMGGDFNGVSLGAVLPFIPVNPETGKPVIFSEGARTLLRSYTVGDLFATDPLTQTPKAITIFRQLDLGSVLSEVYTETLNGNKYVYTSENKGLNLIGNLSLSLITDAIEGAPIDITSLLLDGELKHIGDMEIRELIASFSSDEESYLTVYNGLSALKDILVRDLYRYDDTAEQYVIDVESLLSRFTVGSLMGLTLCTRDSDCEIHSDTSLCDGNLYDPENNLVDMPGIEGDLMKNVVSMPIMSLVSGGFSLSGLVKGVYLGKAFGYQIGSNPQYCAPDCAITGDEHDHEFYWIDGEGKFVGEMFNGLANVTLDDIMTGNFNIDGIINNIQIGSIFGYVYDEVDARWETADGNAVPNEEMADKILYGLYSKTLTDLMSGGLDLNELLGGVYLGDAFGYTPAVKDGYCAPDCVIDAEGHTHNFYWVDGEGKFVGEMFNGLANVTITDILNGNLNIDGIINDIQIGSIFGYVYDEVDARWETADGNAVPNEEIADKILYGLYSKTLTELMNGGFDLNELLGGVYLGEAFGYTTAVKDGYCAPDCAISESHTHNFYWVDSNKEFVGEMFNSLANFTVTDILNGNFNIEGVINGLQIGEIFGYVYDSVDNRWEDANGIAVPNESISDKILYGLYGKTLTDLMNGGLDLNELLGDIYLGEAFGYTTAVKDGYCAPSCDINAEGHVHNFYWVDSNKEFVGEMFNSLANVTLSDVLVGNVKIDGIVNDTTIGEIFGYVYDDVDGRWETADGNAVPNATISDKILYGLYSKSITDLSSGINLDELLQGVYLGEALGYTTAVKDGYCAPDCAISESHTHEFYWVDGEQKFVGELYNGLANVTLTSVLNGNFNVEGIINGIQIGELLGYVYDDVDARWETADGNAVPNESVSDKLMYGLYSKTITDLSSGINLNELLGGVYLGETFGYTTAVKDGYCAPDCAISSEGHTHEFYWVDGEGKFVGELYNGLANVTLTSVLNGNFNVEGIINSLQIGELLGYVYDETDARWEDANGNAVPNESVSDKLMYGLYSKTITDLSSGLDISALLQGVYLGETFGYTIAVKDGYCAPDCDISSAGHTHEFYWVDSEEKFVGELYNGLANSTLTSVLNGTFNVDGIISSVKIGEMLGYVYDETDARWEDTNGVAVSKQTVSEKVMYGLYSKSVTELSSGLQIADLLSGVYFGELLGFTKNGNDWYKGEEKVDALYTVLSNIEVSALINGDVEIEEAIGVLYVGEMMGYTLDDGVWKDGNTQLTDVQVLLAEIKLSEIFEGLDLTVKINQLPLSSVIGNSDNKILKYLGDTKIGELSTKLDGLTLQNVIDIPQTNKVLWAIKGTPINDLSAAINDLEIGKMMGYVYNEDNARWETELGEPVKGIEAKLASLKVSELSSGGISSINFVLSDVIDESTLSSGVFSLLGPDAGDIEVKNLADALKNSMATASYQDLVNAQIISAVNNEDTLDTLFMMKRNGMAPVFTSKDDAHAYWTGLTITALMNEVIDLIGVYLPSA